jgi:hypothetical protein
VAAAPERDFPSGIRSAGVGHHLTRFPLTSLAVGTALVAINQGTTLAAGELPPRLLWQVPLTYAVPFCVAPWGALSNSRS